MIMTPKMTIPNSPFTDVPTAVEEIRAGRMIVVVDDEDRVADAHGVGRGVHPSRLRPR